MRTSWYDAVPHAVEQIGDTISAAAHAIVHVFSPGEFSSLFRQVASPAAADNRTNQLNRPESIVGVVRIAVQGAQSGATTLLEILMIVNIFVGMLNMLPMLPLDGGYVAIATYERVRSRRGAQLPRQSQLPDPVHLHLHERAARLVREHACTSTSSTPSQTRSSRRRLARRRRTRQNGYMDVTATALSPRRLTRQISVGSVKVGGDAPISVQSMTTTKTADVEGTLQQIYALAANGADIVRCTCNDQARRRGTRPDRAPLAGAHRRGHPFPRRDGARRARSRRATGCDSIPGNLRKPEEIKLVASEAKDRGVPIRIGVNAGSLHPDIYERFGGATPEALVESARIELDYFEEVDFHDVKISVKASSVATMIARLPSRVSDVRSPPAPRRDRGRSVAGRPPQGHRGDRDAARRGYWRHAALFAHGRSRRGGEGRTSTTRGARVFVSERDWT